MASVSDIKVINQRISMIAKTFGINSEMYKSVVAPLKTDDFSKFIHTTKSGVIALNNTKEVRESSVGKHLTNTAKRRARTISQIKADYGYEGQTNIKKIKDEIEGKKYYSNNIRKVLDYLYEKNTDSEMKEKLPSDFFDGNTSEESIREVVDKYIDEVEKDEKNEKLPFSDGD